MSFNNWLLEMERTIVPSISGGVDAIKAIKGAAVKARNPPILENDVRKSVLLDETSCRKTCYDKIFC